MQSSHIVPLASAPAGCAVPYSTTRDHCGALRTLLRRSRNPALNIAPPLPGLRHSETVPTRLSRTDSELVFGKCDHLRRPRCAFGRSAPYSRAESRTRLCGCADDHELELIAQTLTRPQRQLAAGDNKFQTARSNSGKQGIRDRAAQIFFDRISQWTRAET